MGGRNDATNLDAQNANVNQIGQRNIEREVSRFADDPNKTVYFDVQNYNRAGVDRPDCTMITVGVQDKTTGAVDIAHYSLQNASYEEQAQWDRLALENTEIDPRQDIGMTPEERALANEYADMPFDEGPLGSGRTVFFDSSAEPISGSREAVIDDGVSLGAGERTVDQNFDDGVSLGASGQESVQGFDAGGISQDAGLDNGTDNSMDVGMDMD